MRHAASPGAAIALLRMNSQIDVRDVLPTISVPTLVLYRRDARFGHGAAAWRATAEDVITPGGQAHEFAELIPARASSSYPAGTTCPGSARPRRCSARSRSSSPACATCRSPIACSRPILFTDIVGSTEIAAELGDGAGAICSSRHHALVRRQLERFRGREIDTAGDGFLATFDGPARASAAPRRSRTRCGALGLEIRAGLHTGECEVRRGKLGGIAVHIGARIAAQAAADEVLVSSTVKDLVAGSGIAFADRGAQELKGVPGEWSLFAVESPGGSS